MERELYREEHENMTKLAEALTLRSDHQKRLAQVEKRTLAVALIQDGDTPPEDPNALLEEYGRLQGQLLELVRRINITNMSNTVMIDTPSHPNQTVSLAQAVAIRERSARMAKFYRSVADTANPQRRDWRYSRTEIKMVPTVSVPELLSRADALSGEARDIDIAIQRKNWEVDLAEE